MHHRKGHFILLLLGTFFFLVWLLAWPLTGAGGAWVIHPSEATTEVPASGHDLGRAVILAKQEAIHVKWMAVQIGSYLAFVALVLGHALLWPEEPSKLKLEEVPPPDEQTEGLA